MLALGSQFISGCNLIDTWLRSPPETRSVVGDSQSSDETFVKRFAFPKGDVVELVPGIAKPRNSGLAFFARRLIDDDLLGD